MSISNLMNETTIARGNRLYQDYRDRWQYLLESYVGGEAYRDGSHLQRYQLETESEYQARLRNAHLDNHCSSVVSIYNSFLFKSSPVRELGILDGQGYTEDFLRDADRDGTNFNNFMKDVATWSSVFGAVWIMVSKPNVSALTLADELATGVRPYVSLLTPLNVLDFTYERSIDGSYHLTYFRYLEEYIEDLQVIKEWTPDTITTYVYDMENDVVQVEEEVDNGLGKIPAVICYNKKTNVRGIGIGDLNDIADCQRFIYNMQNELEQTIRLDSHPSLVCTPETITGNGAGSIIQIPESMDPQLKPYLLQYGGASADSILKSIASTVESIDKMANVGSIRGTEARRMSGVAQEQEFQLLAAKLSEKGDNLELCEEHIWKLFAEYQGQTFNGEIVYPDSYNIRDIHNEYVQLKTARDTATDPRVLSVIDRELVVLLGHEPDLVLAEADFVPHIMRNAEGEMMMANTQEEHQALMALRYTHLED